MHLVADNKRITGVKKKSFLGQTVLVLLGAQLAFFGSFTCFDVPTGTGSNLIKYGHREVRNLVLMAPPEAQAKVRQYVPAIFEAPQVTRYSTYVPLAPTAVAIGYILGSRLALYSISIFLIVGFLGPLLGIYPLASGGGLNYYLEPGFGYLLGMLAASSLCGWITNQRRTSLTQITGIGAGLLALHLCGVLYLIGTYLYFYVLEGSKSYLEWQPWIFQYARNLSWYALPYDFALAFMAVGLAFPFRWLVNTITSSDSGQPVKKVKFDRNSLQSLAEAEHAEYEYARRIERARQLERELMRQQKIERATRAEEEIMRKQRYDQAAEAEADRLRKQKYELAAEAEADLIRKQKMELAAETEADLIRKQKYERAAQVELELMRKKKAERERDSKR